MFSANPPSAATLQVAVSLVSSEHGLSIHKIQALVLLAIVLMGVGQMKQADDCVQKAAELAHSSDLRCMDVNISPSNSHDIRDESFRRSWWELYTIDALLALLRHRAPACTPTVSHPTPFLPRSEGLFDSDSLCRADLVAYAALELQMFVRPALDISSYAHRVEAADIVRQVCLLFIGYEHDIDAMEAANDVIAAWNFRMSAASFASTTLPGTVDSLLLQAHLLVQTAALFLYFPRSDLSVSSPAPVDLTCIGKRTQSLETSGQHTIRVIAASKILGRIATLPWLQTSNSPLMIFGMVLGSAVQISAASNSQASDNQPGLQTIRRKAVLMLSALEAIGDTWPLSLEVFNLFRPIAKSIFEVALQPVPSHIGLSTSDSGVVVDEVPPEGNQMGSSDAAFHNVDWVDFFASFNDADSLLP